MELTAAGERVFRRLAKAAIGFDKRLRAGMTDLDAFRRVLARLRDNVAGG